MVHICAWCERFLGLKADDLKMNVSHGICSPCLERQHWGDDPPVLVLSRSKSHLLPLFTEMLRGTPAIRVIVDRRRRERRLDDEATSGARERRQASDRRGDSGITLN